jgi:hypothetical protein
VDSEYHNTLSLSLGNSCVLFFATSFISLRLVLLSSHSTL